MVSDDRKPRTETRYNQTDPLPRFHIVAARRAPPIGASKATGWRALKKLIQFGFVQVTRDARFRSDDARLYALTMEPIGDQPATKDFMRLTADALAKNRFLVPPMKLASFTHETGENGVLKAANKTNDLTEGVGNRKSGTSRTPFKTAKKPTRPAQNTPIPVSPTKLEQTDPSFTHETHLLYHAGSPNRETRTTSRLHRLDLSVQSVAGRRLRRSQ
jgi:hypothetical protein